MILYQAVNKEAQRVKAAHPDFKFQSYWPTHDPCAWDKINLDDLDGVLGSIEWTYQVFDQLGIPRPPVFNYEWCCTGLQKKFDRMISSYNMGYVRSYKHNFENANRFFFKPQKQLKLFTGEVLSLNEFKQKYDHLDNSCTVEVQNVVQFGQEFRTFWVNKQSVWRCVGGAEYPVIEDVNLVLPHFGLNRNSLLDTPVSALVIDFGWNQYLKKWSIVEVGDVWAMGSYGAEKAYLEAHMMRFKELKESIL